MKVLSTEVGEPLRGALLVLQNAMMEFEGVKLGGGGEGGEKLVGNQGKTSIRTPIGKVNTPLFYNRDRYRNRSTDSNRDSEHLTYSGNRSIQSGSDTLNSESVNTSSIGMSSTDYPSLSPTHSSSTRVLGLRVENQLPKTSHVFQTILHQIESALDKLNFMSKFDDMQEKTLQINRQEYPVLDLIESCFLSKRDKATAKGLQFSLDLSGPGGRGVVFKSESTRRLITELQTANITVSSSCDFMSTETLMNAALSKPTLFCPLPDVIQPNDSDEGEVMTCLSRPLSREDVAMMDKLIIEEILKNCFDYSIEDTPIGGKVSVTVGFVSQKTRTDRGSGMGKDICRSSRSLDEPAGMYESKLVDKIQLDKVVLKAPCGVTIPLVDCWNSCSDHPSDTSPSSSPLLSTDLGYFVIEMIDTGCGVSQQEQQALLAYLSGERGEYAQDVKFASIEMLYFKNILELHNGGAHIYSAGTGLGSTVIIYLPMEKREVCLYSSLH